MTQQCWRERGGQPKTLKLHDEDIEGEGLPLEKEKRESPKEEGEVIDSTEEMETNEEEEMQEISVDETETNKFKS